MLARATGRAPLPSYFLLAVALTWAWWVPLGLTGHVVDEGWRPTHFPGEFGPLLAAVVVTAVTIAAQL
jgi:hypothetical protein